MKIKQWYQRKKDEGLSLRLTFSVMIIVSVAMTAGLLFTTYRTFRSYHSMSDATDAYMELQEAAENLLSASDYLTEEARCYVVLGDRKHMDNYFTEAEVTRRREEAIKVMEERIPESAALFALKQAMEASVELMDREYYSMLLTMKAQGDELVPELMADVRLSAEDEALPPEEKKQLAQRMMHDDGYYVQKNRIRSELKECIVDLKMDTHGVQTSMSKRAYRDLTWMTVLILLQSAALIMMLILTTRLGINPLLKAVEHIKRDQRIPIMGANEFRYLAGTYNKMYANYKRSINNLSFKALHDELTNLYNRAGYDLIKKSIDTTSTALILFDADKFKHINDSFGHQTGDKILKKMALALKQNFRPDDYVFRIGGDEFVVFMVHVDDGVQTLIENKVSQINRELADTRDGLPELSVSVGVSLSQKERDPQEMFREADLALYAVKENGRHGCSFYTEDMENILGYESSTPNNN